MNRLRSFLLVALLLIAAVGAGSLVALGPVVRSRCAELARARDLVVKIGSVRPLWGGVELLDVDISSQGPGERLRGRLDNVRAYVDLSGFVRRVVVNGGALEVAGRPHDVARWLRSARGAEPAARGALLGGKSREVLVSGVLLDWLDLGSRAEGLQVQGMELATEAEGEMRFRAATLSLEGEPGRLLVRDLSLLLGKEEGAFRIRQASGGRVEVEWAARDGDGREGTGVEREGRGLPDHEWIQLARLRHHAMTTAGGVDRHISSGSEIATDELFIRVRRGGQTIKIGPGRARLTREPGRLVGELVAGGGEGGTPLSLLATIPLKPGRIELKAEGGPLTLASLGVEEGNFGLVDVDKATLEARASFSLSEDGNDLAVDADGHLRSFGISDKRLADEAIRGLELGFALDGTVKQDVSLVEVKKGEFNLGVIRLEYRGTLERRPEFLRADFSWAIPSTSCQEMLGSIPRPLVPRIADMSLFGTFGVAGGRIDLDSRRPEELELGWDILGSCRIANVQAEHSVERFWRPFRRLVYDGEGNRVEIVAGRGSGSWASIHDISPYAIAAVLTTEDGRFYRHSGFDKEAIKSSARDNLKAGRFVRGASTISMQLAKNLYLDRGKTLSRKLEEVLFTAYLEQELTKDQILELYFNIVELGPMIYGIGQAAEHYFNTSPGDLSLGQALYLISTLPNPKKQYFGPDGQVSERWMRYLYRLMEIMHARHRITERELLEGLGELVTFGMAESPRREEALEPAEGIEPFQESN